MCLNRRFVCRVLPPTLWSDRGRDRRTQGLFVLCYLGVLLGGGRLAGGTWRVLRRVLEQPAGEFVGVSCPAVSGSNAVGIQERRRGRAIGTRRVASCLPREDGCRGHVHNLPIGLIAALEQDRLRAVFYGRLWDERELVPDWCGRRSGKRKREGRGNSQLWGGSGDSAFNCAEWAADASTQPVQDRKTPGDLLLCVARPQLGWAAEAERNWPRRTAESAGN